MLMLSTAGEPAMARTLAALPEGSRITDYISLGVITKTFPLKRVRAVLAATGKASQLERDLPAHAVLELRMRAQPEHWDAYYAGGAAERAFARKYSLSDRSRYYWTDPQVEASV